jgi:transposase InsO family protein
MSKDADIKIVLLSARSPNLNSNAERCILSLRSECLSRIIPLGERHLRRTIASLVDHYHVERNHEGLGDRLSEPAAATTNAGSGRIR